MFKKFLSKIGIGAATVDLTLDRSECSVGEEITGNIRIKGGHVDQKVGSVYVNLDIRARMEEKTAQRRVESVLIAKNLTVRAGEMMEYPFRYTLPELPQTSKLVSYTFHTTLNIPGAVNQHDTDEFHVLPRASVALVQEALQSLGFRESYDSGQFNGYYQEFEYKVASGTFQSRIDELEVVLFPVPEGVQLHIELDKRGRGLGGFLAEALDMDEQYAVLLLTNETLTSRESVQKALTEFLEVELNNPEPNRSPTLPRFGRKAKHSVQGKQSVTNSMNPAYAAGIVSGFVGYQLGSPLFDPAPNLGGSDDGSCSGGDTGDFGGGDFGGGDSGGGGGGGCD